MKRALIFVALVCILGAGCQIHSQPRANARCRSCGPTLGHGQYSAFRAQQQADYVPQIPHNHYREVQPSGPPTAAYAYPYYTTRGPRDFLLNNPSSIGH